MTPVDAAKQAGFDSVAKDIADGLGEYVVDDCASSSGGVLTRCSEPRGERGVLPQHVLEHQPLMLHARVVAKGGGGSGSASWRRVRKCATNLRLPSPVEIANVNHALG